MERAESNQNLLHVTGLSGGEERLEDLRRSLEALPGIEQATVTPLDDHEWRGTTDIWAVSLRGSDEGVEEVLRDFGASPVSQGEPPVRGEERPR
jgi:hypothetical protein